MAGFADAIGGGPADLYGASAPATARRFRPVARRAPGLEARALAVARGSLARARSEAVKARLAEQDRTVSRRPVGRFDADRPYQGAI